MKKNFVNRIYIVVLAALTLTSCGKKDDYKNTSRATGWNITGKDGGFKANTDYQEQPNAPGLVFIEGGTFTMGRVQDDVMHDWNNTPTQQHIQSYYMDETEVTNNMYLQYLDYLKKVYPPEETRYRNIYYGALPDTLVWRNRLGFNETMTENYLRHPAYANYPVVGVSWIQAVEFSKWRTDRYNELILEREGYTAKGAKNQYDAESTFSTSTYLNAPSLVYGGQDELIRGGRESERREKDNTPRASKDNPDVSTEAKDIYVRREDGVLSPGFYRLPTEAEWEYAALGLSDLRDYNVYRGRKKYPWDGAYTRSGSRKDRGDQLANFKQGNGDYGGIAGWSDDNADITAEIKSYAPNDYGLYDMAGNVSEWVADVYRPIIDDEFNDFNYYRGNVYTKNAINQDGTVQVVTTDDIVYDTLENGKIVARNLPGEILQVPVDENDTYLRTQFSQSDNRDFRDGDKQSSRYYQSFADADSDADRMYDSPINKIDKDSTAMVKKYDKSNTRTTLIDDEVRVYKGGSWRDREYWLDPAQRRYLPQIMATDDIGFRNAMSRVGSKSRGKTKTRN
ncbi:MAG: gliding motility lipoprotein GldJ [Leeuwenhoekiella sp.]